MTDYDFKITLDGGVSCTYDTPQLRGVECANEIVREPHLETILLLEQWLRRWERIARLERRAREHAATRGVQLLVPDTFKVLGRHLWQLALDGEVGQHLIKAVRTAEPADDETGPRIRVRLIFKEGSKDLASLPWEFVWCPELESYLATETKLVLGRFVPRIAEGHIECNDQGEAVRVLFVVSLPRNDDFYNERVELDALRAELGKVRNVELDLVNEWVPERVVAALANGKGTKRRVDVVHLVGVCQEHDGSPVLYLPHEGGGATWMKAQPVVDVLTNDRANLPKLVVLHLSDWERDPSEHFEQLAPAFVTAGIPAVLAMQYPMPPEKGRSFVTSLYERLASGARIGEAVQMARKQLWLGQPPNRQFGTPVLYLQSAVDGSLIPRAVSETEDPGHLEPSAAMQSLKSAPAADGAVRRLLLDQFEGVGETPAVVALREWVAEMPWPDDRKKAWKVVKLRYREQVDVEAQLLCKLMMRALDPAAGGTA